MSSIIESLTAVIIHLISSSGYAGVFLLTALDSSVVPIPSEIVMPFAGFLVSTGKINFWILVIVATLASLLGSIFTYYIGLFLEETVLLKLIKKYGKLILVTEEDYHTSKKWFDKYGDKIVLIGRLIPGIRAIISIPAGMFEMPLRKFLIYTFIGSAVWNTGLAYVGVSAGRNWAFLEPIFRKFEIGIVILIIASGLLYVNHKLKIIRIKR